MQQPRSYISQVTTGRFIIFSVITNIYNKKIKGSTLMEFSTATGKLKKFFFFDKMQRPSHNQPYFTYSKDNSKDTRIERKIEDVLGEDQFGFTRGKGTRDAIGMMRIIAERTFEIDEEL
jgi:hypothetical protein